MQNLKNPRTNKHLRNRPQRRDKRDHRSSSLRTHRPALQGHDAQPRRRRRFVPIRLRVDEAAARAQAEAGVALLEREDEAAVCSQNPVSFTK